MITSYLIRVSVHRTTIRTCTKWNVFRIRFPHPERFGSFYQFECKSHFDVKLIVVFRANHRIHRMLTQLNPEQYYAVYVMLRFNNISLPYDKLIINTNSMCAFEYKPYLDSDDGDGIIPNDLM